MEFPSALEAVYVGGGLWLRVKVLTLADAIRGKDALRMAVHVAVSAMEPELPIHPARPEDESQRVQRLSRHAAAVAGVARTAVVGHAWSEQAQAAEAARDALVQPIEAQAAGRYQEAQTVHAAALEAVDGDAEAVAAAGRVLVAAVAEVDAWLTEARASVPPLDPGPVPAVWLPLTVVPNPQDEDRQAGRLCVAALDQVAMLWSYRVADVALRAAWEAQREVRPLSASGR